MLAIFQEKCLHNANLREACDEALWLLRSEKKGGNVFVMYHLLFKFNVEECVNTSTEMFEAVEKRRSLSQVSTVIN